MCCRRTLFQVIINSIMLSIAVRISCTFFGLVLIYTRASPNTSAIIGRIFSILPIVTPPPFVVGLGRYTYDGALWLYYGADGGLVWVNQH